MKKTNFAEQLQKATTVTQKATKFIETAPLKKGQTIQLFDEDTEDINDMPLVTRVDKYNNYDEFGVTAVSKSFSEDQILIHLQGKGEASDEVRVVPAVEIGSYYMLDDYSTCVLADIISYELSKK